MESQMKRLKEEADIKTVVDALGIPVERKGMNYFLCCPSRGMTTRTQVLILRTDGIIFTVILAAVPLKPLT